MLLLDVSIVLQLFRVRKMWRRDVVLNVGCMRFGIDDLLIHSLKIFFLRSLRKQKTV